MAWTSHVTEGKYFSRYRFGKNQAKPLLMRQLYSENNLG